MQREEEIEANNKMSIIAYHYDRLNKHLRDYDRAGEKGQIKAMKLIESRINKHIRFLKQLGA
jgi:hypothetical protein